MPRWDAQHRGIKPLLQSACPPNQETVRHPRAGCFAGGTGPSLIAIVMHHMLRLFCFVGILLAGFPVRAEIFHGGLLDYTTGKKALCKLTLTMQGDHAEGMIVFENPPGGGGVLKGKLKGEFLQLGSEGTDGLRLVMAGSFVNARYVGAYHCKYADGSAEQLGMFTLVAQNMAAPAQADRGVKTPEQKGEAVLFRVVVPDNRVAPVYFDNAHNSPEIGLAKAGTRLKVNHQRTRNGIRWYGLAEAEAPGVYYLGNFKRAVGSRLPT